MAKSNTIISYRGNCGGCHYPDAEACKVEGLSVSYGPTGQRALDDVSLRVGRGERIALVGDNGSGKSTLLKSLAGLITPQDGTIKVLGHVAGVCRHEVSYLPQRSTLDWDFPISVRNFVLTGSYVRLGWFIRPAQKERACATTALEQMNLLPLAQRQIGSLSGGQQQRALVARTLLHTAELYLLDEPFNAVDASSRNLIWDALDKLRENDSTVIMATHDIGHFLDRFDRVITLENGQICEQCNGCAD